MNDEPWLRAPFRSKKVLNAAREMACQFCGIDNGTIVMAHSNQLKHGKGMGIKASDVFVAALCYTCHNIVDGRCAPDMARETRDYLWTTAHKNTIAYLMKKGLLPPEAIDQLTASGSLSPSPSPTSSTQPERRRSSRGR